ncbi:hypothetical protein [Streptacidiphilus fuscans]|uniref:Uncharacterized protein n=1 Tax=Streptacidiphilus fuscans TaxID=2789292 RepID=A0A931BAV9_9ACTN|nr:hypothetical protein [Streptacidiphilus fuscans]MBF9071862.1 hypothetical protein [Streptacidiphilus fuscans]
MPTPDARAAYALGGRSLPLLVPVGDTPDARLGDTDSFSQAHALAAALTDALGAGPSRCRLLLPGRHTTASISDAIREAGRHSSTLIVYVAGRLGIDSDGRLALSGPSTEAGPTHPRQSLPGLPWPALAAAVGTADSPQRLLLADLHATTGAWRRLHRQPGTAPLLLKAAGTALLGHLTAPDDGIAAPSRFTEQLTTVLRHGDHTGPPILTISGLAARMRSGLPRGSSRLTVFDPDTTRIAFRNQAAPVHLGYRAPTASPTPGQIGGQGRHHLISSA